MKTLMKIIEKNNIVRKGIVYIISLILLLSISSNVIINNETLLKLYGGYIIGMYTIIFGILNFLLKGNPVKISSDIQSKRYLVKFRKNNRLGFYSLSLLFHFFWLFIAALELPLILFTLFMDYIIIFLNYNITNLSFLNSLALILMNIYIIYSIYKGLK